MPVRTITYTPADARAVAAEQRPVARLGHYLTVDGRMTNSLPVGCKWCPARFTLESLLDEVWQTGRYSERDFLPVLNDCCCPEKANNAGFHTRMNEKNFPAVLGNNQFETLL